MKKCLVMYCMVLFGANGIYGQKKADSTILLKETLSDGSYHVVFIDKAKNSIFKQAIQKLDAEPDDYLPQVTKIKDSLRLNLHKFRIPDLARVWYSLYLYKNRYYIYKASDPGTSPWVKITDSTITKLYFDPGPVVSLLTNYRKLQNAVQLQHADITNRNATTTIHMIDKDRGIAIFEYDYEPAENKYALMVAEDKLHLFPIIVNYNPTSRMKEWVFQTPDYEKLLKRKQ